MLQLSSGHYLGKTLRRTCLSGLTVTWTTYPSVSAYPWHVHEHATLFVLLAGQHREENRQTAFDQPPLSVVLHPTIGPHATIVGPAGMVGINLELTNAWLDGCQLRQRDLPVDCRLLDSMWSRLLGLRLASFAHELGEAADAEAESVVLELLAGLLQGRPKSPRTPRWLPRAEEFLRGSLGAHVGLRDLAAELGLHPVYCARAFRQAVGCTVTAYVQALRLVDAGRQILVEGRALSDVALRAGFADQPHLTRVCSRTLGFTPGQLQRVRQEFLSTPAGSFRSRPE